MNLLSVLLDDAAMTPYVNRLDMLGMAQMWAARPRVAGRLLTHDLATWRVESRPAARDIPALPPAAH